jgi:hypothetical protein
MLPPLRLLRSVPSPMGRAEDDDASKGWAVSVLLSLSLSLSLSSTEERDSRKHNTR